MVCSGNVVAGEWEGSGGGLDCKVPKGRDRDNLMSIAGWAWDKSTMYRVKGLKRVKGRVGLDRASTLVC